jgi:hypothetical protein
MSGEDSKMRRRGALVLLLVLVVMPAIGYPQANCVARPLSDQQIRDIIQKERATRTDLPKPFPKDRWLVRRQGCHYVYIEYGLPEAPEYNQIFKLNQHGAIVDVQAGGQSVESLKCPDKALTESELAEIVKKARAKRGDLPSQFPKHRTRVERLRCLYLYFEYALPERRGDYQVFTIDPFGELMEFSRSQPY